MRIVPSVFEEELLQSRGYSLEDALERCGASDIPVKVLECFDRLMLAKDTDEISDLTQEDIIEIARHSTKLTKLYKTQRFLTDTTYKRLLSMKSVTRRRVL